MLTIDYFLNVNFDAEFKYVVIFSIRPPSRTQSKANYFTQNSIFQLFLHF
jgi:hypothetical protein